MFPIYGPGDWNEMSIELLNVTDDFQVNCLVMFEVVILIAYREYKKTITNIQIQVVTRLVAFMHWDRDSVCFEISHYL